MNHYPASILNLIKNFGRLPGIGEKTAERLAMHILRARRVEAEQLAQSIMDLKQNTRLCSKCFALSDKELCKICESPARNQSLLCVVEKPADMAAIEQSGAFTGVYHILQGALSPMDGIGPEDIKIRELIKRVENGNIDEIVIATSTTVEGEATASYISKELERFQLRITRIASGVPVGGDLKYVDQVTLKRAMETRHVI
ncbi:MAG: recombination protein RecR [Desulfobacterales bacterium]|mgnify:CR=1 FL=1|jgi:recombination protein RecR|nr:recombination protein RecR [Desulfobacteraceae bacterium]MBT7084652.1 recombination protein RecR [Desulfobacterales bacterium]MBT7698215.1 recombination protein RecR [Desulfobacterales bacterium]